MPVTSDYWVAAAGLLLVGVGWSCVNVAVTALIADTVPAVERGRAVGVVDSFAGLASIVLPFTPAPRWRTTGEPSGRSSSCSATRRRPSARRWGTPIPTRSTGGWYATSAPSRRFQRDSKLPVLRRLGLLEEAQADERTGRCKKANTEAVWRSKRIVSRRQASIQALVRSTIQRCRPDRSLDSIRRRAIRGVMPPWRSTRRQNAKSAVLAVQLGWALARAARLPDRAPNGWDGIDQRFQQLGVVHAFVGRMHLTGGLFEPIIPRTISELVAIGPDFVLPGHCTGWRASNLLVTNSHRSMFRAMSERVCTSPHRIWMRQPRARQRRDCLRPHYPT